MCEGQVSLHVMAGHKWCMLFVCPGLGQQVAMGTSALCFFHGVSLLLHLEQGMAISRQI